MFSIDYVALFSSVSPSIATILIAMLPIAELRAALPIALGVYKIPLPAAYFYSVIGNILPILFILWLLGPVSKYLVEHFRIAKKFFDWLFKRTRNKFEGKYRRYGELALIIFVAVPSPLTGAWTGSIAAFLFGIPWEKALILISIGVLIAGVIVTLIYQGILGGLSFLI